MSELALYRKYRPGGFDEVVGQEHVVRTLRNAVAAGAVAHGYLFAGPKGTGKTTLARVLAKAVNCEKPAKSGDPCRTCESCKDIEAGRVLDIIEIDAASNRGIDEIRELREGVRVSPTRLKYKVYIIDEAHQLTKEAFNALLKTLEEPPAHAIFVFATTAADKMPATILSRVQRFDFRKFSVEQIVGKLKGIAKAEKVQVGEEALRMLAHAAEGGLRDAESMFAQTLSHAGGKLTAETVQEALGIVGFAETAALFDLLAKKDLVGSLRYVHALEEKGRSAEEVLRSSLGYARKAMLLQVDEGLRDVVASELTSEQYAVLAGHAKQFERAQLETIARAFMEAQDNLRKTPIPLLPLELALMQVLG